jgi:hypothetical protein
MSLVTEILTADQLNELWRSGYTITRRQNDPFEIDAKLIPRGMAYQWNSVTLNGKEMPEGWTPVPFSRHEGVFAPWGTPGDAHIGALVLVEKAKADVDHAQDVAHAKAYQNVTDWVDRQAKAGFTGFVTEAHQTRLGTIGDIKRIEVGATETVEIPSTRTIETTVGIPPDMAPHLQEIFKERDRLEGEVVMKNRTLKEGPIADKFYAAIEADKGAPWWPTLRAILLPIAVENVRANLKKEKTDD